MSHEAREWVWEHSPYSGTMLHVHLVLADHVNAQRGEAWPSVDTIASRARVSERQVRRCLRQMEADGTIVLVREGRGVGNTNVYNVPTTASSTSSGGTSVASPTPVPSPSGQSPSPMAPEDAYAVAIGMIRDVEEDPEWKRELWVADDAIRRRNYVEKWIGDERAQRMLDETLPYQRCRLSWQQEAQDENLRVLATSTLTELQFVANAYEALVATRCG